MANDTTNAKHDSYISDKNHDWKTCISLASNLPEEQEMILDAVEYLANQKGQPETRDPIFTTQLPYEVVDDWNQYCLCMDTNECYNTKGGLTPAGKLKNPKIMWAIKESYNKQIESFAQRKGVSCSAVHVLDQCIRMKQARGVKPWTLVLSFAKPQTALLFLTDSELYRKYKLGQEDHSPPVFFKNSNKVGVQVHFKKT